jgi:hypothetical protein
VRMDGHERSVTIDDLQLMLVHVSSPKVRKNGGRKARTIRTLENTIATTGAVLSPNAGAVSRGIGPAGSEGAVGVLATRVCGKCHTTKPATTIIAIDATTSMTALPLRTAVDSIAPGTAGILARPGICNGAKNNSNCPNRSLRRSAHAVTPLRAITHEVRMRDVSSPRPAPRSSG